MARSQEALRRLGPLESLSRLLATVPQSIGAAADVDLLGHRLVLINELLNCRLQLMKFKIVNIVSLVLIHKKLGKFEMVVSLVQNLLLQVLLFEFLGLLLVILLGRVEHALAQLVALFVNQLFVEMALGGVLRRAWEAAHAVDGGLMLVAQSKILRIRRAAHVARRCGIESRRTPELILLLWLVTGVVVLSAPIHRVTDHLTTRIVLH